MSPLAASATAVLALPSKSRIYRRYGSHCRTHTPVAALTYSMKDSLGESLGRSVFQIDGWHFIHYRWWVTWFYWAHSSISWPVHRLLWILVQADHRTEDEEKPSLSGICHTHISPTFPIPINYFYIIAPGSSPNALIPSIPSRRKILDPPRKKKLFHPLSSRKSKSQGFVVGKLGPCFGDLTVLLLTVRSKRSCT